MKPVKIKFWGVRGSIPTPGGRTLRYGGNTACVEVQFPGCHRFILDAGSGIRELGKELLQLTHPVKAFIFISHFHWDHIQGLPFFKPAFIPDNHFVIFGCDEPHLPLNEIISMQMKPTFFPVSIEDMQAHIEFRVVREETFTVDGVQVATKFVNHPGYALGYRFTFQGKSLVYVSDNEPFNNVFQEPPLLKDTEDVSVEERFESYVEDKVEDFVAFIRDCDVLIHDTQFLPEEYQEKISWGHSPYNYTVELAVRAQVKQLVLFHHDPDHDDQTVDHILELSRQKLKELGYDIPCIAAQEGSVLEF